MTEPQDYSKWHANILAGAPMSPMEGWVAVSQYSETISFGHRAEVQARRHIEDYGGRLFRVEMREIPND